MKPSPEVGLSEIFQKPSWFCSLTFSSKVSGGGGPIWGLRNMKNPASEGVSVDHHKNKQMKIIDCMMCFCCKGSFSSCIPIWHRRFWQSGAWPKFWPNF